ncbi:DUF3253 domain-containing protein [Pelagibius sp.]|uniref:DUF3253 domain-containing protein n=1 Tax=Pelagibius sp. TaxID=1931238 RepID=UPI00260B01E5|nr:DUF3253 domain-containing protein [Pelagibius sp.]
MTGFSEGDIAACILALCRARGAGKTVCPSEVARRLAPDGDGWRALMPAVRAAAAVLARDGRVVILQKGVAVCPGAARGPIRLGLPPP